MSYSLIVSIVPHNSGEFITDTARKAGASGASILMGRGTAGSKKASEQEAAKDALSKRAGIK